MDQSSRALQKISTGKRAVFNINQGYRSVLNNPTSSNQTREREIPSGNIFVNCNFILDTDLRRLIPSPIAPNNEFEPSQLRPSPVNSNPRTNVIRRSSISSMSSQPSDQIDQQYGTSSGRMNRERVQYPKDTYIRHRSSSTTKDNNQELPLRYTNVRGQIAPINNQKINSEYYVVLSPANNACFANVIVQSFLSLGNKFSQFIIEDEKTAIKTQLSVFFYAQALKSKEAYKTQALRECLDRQLGQLGIDSNYSKNELYDAGKFFEHIMEVSSPKLRSLFALSVSLIIHLIIFLNNFNFINL